MLCLLDFIEAAGIRDKETFKVYYPDTKKYYAFVFIGGKVRGLLSDKTPELIDFPLQDLLDKKAVLILSNFIPFLNEHYWSFDSLGNPKEFFNSGTFEDGVRASIGLCFRTYDAAVDFKSSKAFEELDLYRHSWG